jgi:hypothetical protein
MCWRKASLVRRTAYSRKLYAANWFPWRRSLRYCVEQAVSLVLLYSGEIVVSQDVSVGQDGPDSLEMGWPYQRADFDL